MATRIAAVGGGNFTAGGTWVGGVAPTAADDAQLAVTSGNVTVDAGSVCRSLDCTGYTGTLTHTAGVTLTIGDGTAGASNIALKLVAGMTYTLGNAATSAVSFVSTSATQQTVAAAGKTLGNVTVNGAGSSYLLSDGVSTGSTATVTLTAGILNTNGQSCSWGAFSSSNSNTRTLTMGASAITVTGASGWNGTYTNFTWTTNTGSITLSGVSATVVFPSTVNGTAINCTGGGAVGLFGLSSGSNTFTFTGTASKTCILQMCGSKSFGTFTVNANSAVNRVLVYSANTGGSATPGTAITITAATVVVSNIVDFMDITGAGAATWTVAGTGATALGDCGGNSGITFSPSVTQTATGTSSFTWSTHGWTTRVPLPQDDVVISNAFSASQTVTADMPRLGRSIDFSACTGTPKLTHASPTTIYGSFNGTGITNNSAQDITLAGRSSYTINAGNSLLAGGGYSLYITAPGGTYTLTGDLQIGNTGIGTGFYLVAGTFDAGAFNVYCGGFSASGTITRTVKIGSGTWQLWGTGGTTMMFGAGTVANGCTVVPGTAILDITGTDSGVTKTFQGSDQTFPTLRHTSTGSAALTITGNNSFAALDLECTTARTITLPAGGNQTIRGALTLKGASGQNLSLVSSTPGTATTITVMGTYTNNAFLTLSGDIIITIARIIGGIFNRKTKIRVW